MLHEKLNREIKWGRIFKKVSCFLFQKWQRLQPRLWYANRILFRCQDGSDPSHKTNYRLEYYQAQKPSRCRSSSSCKKLFNQNWFSICLQCLHQCNLIDYNVIFLFCFHHYKSTINTVAWRMRYHHLIYVSLVSWNEWKCIVISSSQISEKYVRKADKLLILKTYMRCSKDCHQKIVLP